MIATRSYMNIEPISLSLCPKSLRRGLIYPLSPSDPLYPTSLLLQDSGMVPVQTQVAIVNPETCRLCHVGEYGEIWVVSEANVHSFYGSKDPFDDSRFRGRIVDGDDTEYVRTGDLGFLHTVSRPIGPGGGMVEMQILFLLGGIGDTIEVNGLQHFPIDIESSVERCHRNIVPSGSACFQAGGLVVVLVEVHIKSYLASMVPVIVGAILDGHQVVVDIVAFVGKGDFPRSRLGEKQRGKILAGWVTRRGGVVAQFGIRGGQGGLTPRGTPRGTPGLGTPAGSFYEMQEGGLQELEGLELGDRGEARERDDRSWRGSVRGDKGSIRGSYFADGEQTPRLEVPEKSQRRSTQSTWSSRHSVQEGWGYGS